MKESVLERNLAFQIKALGLPVPEREYYFHPPRRWRVDFFFKPDLAVEVEGGTYSNGRHSRGTGFEKDCEKYNQMTLDGIRLLRFTGKHIRTGEAVNMIEQALGRKP